MSSKGRKSVRRRMHEGSVWHGQHAHHHQHQYGPSRTNPEKRSIASITLASYATEDLPLFPTSPGNSHRCARRIGPQRLFAAQLAHHVDASGSARFRPHGSGRCDVERWHDDGCRFAVRRRSWNRRGGCCHRVRPRRSRTRVDESHRNRSKDTVRRGTLRNVGCVVG